MMMMRGNKTLINALITVINLLASFWPLRTGQPRPATADDDDAHAADGGHERRSGPVQHATAAAA